MNVQQLRAVVMKFPPMSSERTKAKRRKECKNCLDDLGECDGSRRMGGGGEEKNTFEERVDVLLAVYGCVEAFRDVI